MQPSNGLPRLDNATDDPRLPPRRLRSQPRPTRTGQPQLCRQNSRRRRGPSRSAIAKLWRNRRPEVSHSRESGVKQVPCLLSGTCQARLEVGGRYLPRSQPPEVHVCIDQPGQHPIPGQVNHRMTRSVRDLSGQPAPLDPSIRNPNCRIPLRSGPSAVPQVTGQHNRGPVRVTHGVPRSPPAANCPHGHSV